MKRMTALFLAVMMLMGCLTLTGCRSRGQSAKEKYGMDYYTRSDGKRIWYYT
jgi:hypothetical protein